MGVNPEHQRKEPDGIAWIGRDRATNDPGPAGFGPSGVLDSLRRRPGSRIAIGIGLVLIVGVLLWIARPWGAPASSAVSESEATLPLVSVVQPASRPVTTTVSFTGTIRARHDMPIGPEGEGGRITAVHVDVGDRVRRGQLLARLDDAVLRPQVARLAAALEEAQAQADLSAAEYERAQGVATAGALSSEEIERRRAAAVTDEARVKVAAAQLAEAQARLDRLEIRAPADGVVLTRNAEVGQTATPGGEPLFRLAQGGEVELRGQVAEQDLPLLAVGQPASVRLTGYPEPFPGKIRLLGAVIDPATRLGEIRVALEPDPALRPGAFARGEVVVEKAERPVLPQTAVLADAQGSYVLIVGADGTVERRAVEVSGTVPRGIVIASGLDGDERVVTTAAGFLREGEKVRVATEQTS